MADPITNKVQLTGYAGVQAGVIKSPSDNAYLNSGATFGGQVSYRGTFLRGQIEAGTALGGKLELGHTFDIGRNMGLELSAKAQTSKSLVGNNTFNASDSTFNSYTANINTQGQSTLVSVEVPGHSDYSANWKGGETRVGGAAKFTFGSNKAKFGIGIEAGTRKGNAPTMSYAYESNSNIDIVVDGKPVTTEHKAYSSVMVKPNNARFYATPTFTADVKISKNLSFNANADFQQGQVGIRYNF